MNEKRLKGRELKTMIRDLLGRTDSAVALEAVLQLPALQVVNPLFSFLCSTETMLKWRAVAAMGIVVSQLSETHLESARIVIRRLMWSLNDESGGIGWGAPEAMGEALARSPSLAKEYASILGSYIDPEGNFLESDILQAGVLWGIGRVAHAHPRRMSFAAPFLVPFMSSANPVHRGLSAWAAGPMAAAITGPPLVKIINDTDFIDIFIDGTFLRRQIGTLAAEALDWLRAAAQER